MISLIAALDENGLIGKINTLPWHLPADLQHFKELTIGKVVVMGSNTYESIGHPLPKRRNIVISHKGNYEAPGCEVVHSIDEALEATRDDDEVMIIGGASIYEQFLPHTDRMYLTRIHHTFEGDTYFPEYESSEWHEVEREEHEPDDKNEYPYTFLVLERVE